MGTRPYLYKQRNFYGQKNKGGPHKLVCVDNSLSVFKNFNHKIIHLKKCAHYFKKGFEVWGAL